MNGFPSRIETFPKPELISTCPVGIFRYSPDFGSK